jgi:TATA-box binding protein (TBP) (component of TFIID and TFIIIB)
MSCHTADISVDEEWNLFLISQHVSGLGFTSISSHTNKNNIVPPSLSAIDKPKKEWIDKVDIDPPLFPNGIGPNATDSCDIPHCEDLYISTKTKVLFFNMPIDIHAVFWNIPIIEYWQPKEGVIKKQMKIVSKTPEEFQDYKEKLTMIPYYNEHIIKQIDNPGARSIKFKDERKITVGISKKDIMNCRGKVKNAFYNCFALIFRFRYHGAFREIHVKIFNTGKMEIPGVLNDEIWELVQQMILKTIQPHVDQPLFFVQTDVEHNVLINSNFNCGYFIHLEKLYTLLRSDKYRIESAYEPCSYPGVKCKFYFHHDMGMNPVLQNGQVLAKDRSLKMSELGDNVKYTPISFMIFRTGSCLIVGNCNECILNFVFEFIKKFFAEEYMAIRLVTDELLAKAKKKKIRKRSVNMSGKYFTEKVDRDNVDRCLSSSLLNPS